MGIRKLTTRWTAFLATMLLAGAASATPIVTVYIDDDATFGEGAGDANEQAIVLGAGGGGGVAFHNALSIVYSGVAVDSATDRLSQAVLTLSGTGSVYVTVVASPYSNGDSATAISTFNASFINNATVDAFTSVDGETVMDITGITGTGTLTALEIIDPLNDPYEIVSQAFIDVGAGGGVSFDITTLVPAPAPLAFFGLMLLGAGFAGRRRG